MEGRPGHELGMWKNLEGSAGERGGTDCRCGKKVGKKGSSGKKKGLFLEGQGTKGGEEILDQSGFCVEVDGAF